MAASLTKDLSKKYNEKFQNSIASFRSGVGKIREQVNRLKLDNAKYEWSVLQLKEDKQIVNKKNEELQRDLDECRNILSELREEKLLCESDLNGLLKESENFKEECQQLKRNAKDNLSENASLRLKLEACENRINQLENQHSDDKENYNVLQEKCCNMYADLESTKREYDSVCKQKDNEVAKMKSVVIERTNLEEKLKEALEIEKQNSLKMQQSEEEIMKVTNKNEQIEASLKKFRMAMAKNKEAKVLQDEKLKELNEANDKLIKEKEKYIKMEDELHALKEKYDTRLTSEEKLSKQLERIQKENEELRLQVENMCAIESNLNKSIGDLSSTNETNMKQIQRIEDKEKLTRNRYDSKTSYLEHQIQKTKEDIQLTKNELTEQRKECSALKQDNLTKGFKIHELERRLKEKDTLLNAKKVGLRI